MSWVKKIRSEHQCEIPFLQGYEFYDILPGSIWRCDGCGLEWRVIPAGQPYGKEWKRIEYGK